MSPYRPLGRFTTRICGTATPPIVKLRFLTGAAHSITTRERGYLQNGLKRWSSSACASERLSLAASQGHMHPKGFMAPLSRAVRSAASCLSRSWLARHCWPSRTAPRILQQEKTYSESRFQRMKNTEHWTALWAYGSSMPLASRNIRRHHCSPLSARYPNDGACERIRSIAGVKRAYSRQCGSQMPDITVQGSESLNDALQDDRSTGAGVSENQRSMKSPITQRTALGINVATQQVSPSSPPAEEPTPKYWSHRLYKNQDGENIPVHYCQSLESTEKVAQLFLNETVLGFDMEWQSQASIYDSIGDNVSVIQLASRDRIALFHISRFVPGKTLEDLVSPTLKCILESPDSTKVGVAIKSDCTRLRKYLGIDVRGSFELSHLYKLVKHLSSNPAKINKRLVSLSEQVEEHFGLPLLKDDNVRCSDWACILSQPQLHYAATDAYAGYQLFHTMDAKRRALDPAPPLPAHAELNIPIRVVHPTDNHDIIMGL